METCVENEINEEWDDRRRTRIEKKDYIKEKVAKGGEFTE